MFRSFGDFSFNFLKFLNFLNSKAGVKRRTSHEPNRMLVKLNEGEQRVFLICIRFGS